MKRIYDEKQFEEGDFFLFLYHPAVKLSLKLSFDYGLVTWVSGEDYFVKWFFDPCEANDHDDSPDLLHNISSFNGDFYLIKKDVPVNF